MKSPLLNPAFWQALISGQAIPEDGRVGESLPHYIARRFAELMEMLKDPGIVRQNMMRGIIANPHADVCERNDRLSTENDQLRAQLEKPTFQSRVQAWMQECFGPVIAADKQERAHRFLEEALELVQAGGCTAEEAHQLVDYVFSRPVGELSQEVGGVRVTLSALCTPHGIDEEQAAETELARITQPEIVLKIRAKQASKPAFGPLPGAYPERAAFKQGA